MKQKQKIDLFAIINWLNKHENWVNTSPEVTSGGIKIIKEVNNLKLNHEKSILETVDEFSSLIRVAAYLKFDIFIRMFNELGIKQVGFGGDALLFCYNTGKNSNESEELKSEVSVILQIFTLLIRAELIYKIFGEENRERVLKVVKELESKGEFS